MNIELLFELMELDNFRCYDVREVGPFKAFNIIYGRNGVGKTSLLEAIEIALTGTSTRIQSKDKLIEVVNRDPGKPLKIFLKKSNHEPYSYDSSKNRPFEPKKVLEKLYNIKAQGQKAKNLLPDLFETHNLLYAERVVQFLEANKREKLQDVLNELVAGRETMVEWGKIVESRLIANRLYSEHSKKKADLIAEKKKLENELSTMKKESSKNLKSQWALIQKNVPKIFLQLINAEQGICTPVFIKNLQNIIEKLRDAHERCREVSNNSGFLGEIKCLSYQDFVAKSKDLDQKARDVTQKIIDVENQIKKTQKDKDSLKKNLIESRLQIDALEKRIKELSSLHKIARKVKSWLPEVIADHRCIDLEKTLLEVKNSSKLIRSAIQEKKMLPESESIKRTIQEYSETERALKKERKLYKQLQDQVNEKKTELGKVKEQLQGIQSREQRLKQSLTEMHARLKEFIKLSPSNECPACGSIFNKPEGLWAAIENTRKRFEELTGIMVDQTALKLKLRLENEIGGMEEKVQKLISSIPDIKSKQKAISKKLTGIQELVRNVYISYKAAGFDIPIIPADCPLENQMEAILKIDIIRNLKKITEKEEKLSEQLKTIWGGLRRDEYISQRYEIGEALNTLKDDIAKIDVLEHPKLSMASYDQLLNDIKKIISKARKEALDKSDYFQRSKVKVVELKEFLEQKNKDKEQYNQHLVKFQSHKNQITVLKSQLDYLLSLKLVNEKEIGFLQNMRETLNESIAAVEAFEKMASQLLEANRLREHLEKNIQLIGDRLSAIEINLQKLKECQSRLKKVTSPQEYTALMLKRHERTISSFFLNLHWPRDFSAVRIETEGEFMISVANTISPEKWNPAHFRLSAGQRAALAVSVFWTLNTAFESVPNVILMDEPVQNIDELNILNFLDGLRWFIERTKRQVFLTTASQRIEALIRKKFAYLKEDFLELWLQREYDCTKIRYLDWKGAEINVAKEKRSKTG